MRKLGDPRAMPNDSLEARYARQVAPDCHAGIAGNQEIADWAEYAVNTFDRVQTAVLIEELLLRIKQDGREELRVAAPGAVPTERRTWGA